MEARMRRFTVADLMSTDVVTLEQDEDLDVADKVMSLARIRHLPVVDRDRVVGLVTHRDLLAAQFSTLADVTTADEEELRQSVVAGEIMRSNVRTVPPTMPVLEAARIMQRHKYGCLPVVEDGKIVGILTEADFLELVVRALEEDAES
jgi:CBS domain-containing membrane protein